MGTATQAVGLDEFPTSTLPNIVLTLGGASITANSNTQFIIGDQTLTRMSLLFLPSLFGSRAEILFKLLRAICLGLSKRVMLTQIIP